MYQFIPLHSCDYLKKSFNYNKRCDWQNEIAKMKSDTEQTMKLE